MPVVYDNLSSGHRWPLSNGGRFWSMVSDILDRARLGEVLTKYRPIGVIHFAAVSSVGESVLDPAKYYWNNVAGTVVRPGGGDARFRGG